MDKTIAGHSLIVASGGQVSTALSDEAVILDMERGVYYGLSAVGARVWELIQQPRTFDEVCDVVLNEYDVPADVVSRDLQALLQNLVERSLVEIRDR